MLNHVFFVLGFCFLLAHEMDAIRCKEWRIFPVTSRMDDEAGYLAFTSLHIPLYALLLWGLFGGDGMNRGLMAGLDAFFMVHSCSICCSSTIQSIGSSRSSRGS